MTAEGLDFVDAATQQRILVSWAQIDRPRVVRVYLWRACIQSLLLLLVASLVIWMLPWLALKVVVAIGVLLVLLIRWRLMTREFLEFGLDGARLRIDDTSVDPYGNDDPFHYYGLVNDILGHQGHLPIFEKVQRQKHQLSDYRCLGCGGSAFNSLRDGLYQCTQCAGLLELYDPWWCPDSEVMMASQRPASWAPDQSGAPDCPACAVKTQVCVEIDGNYFHCQRCNADWYPPEVGRRLFL